MNDIIVTVKKTVIEVQPVIGPKGDKGDTGTGNDWVTLTQAEYDALSVPEQDDTTKTYNISDS